MTPITQNAQLTTCLWFNNNAREAAEYYVRIFPNSRMLTNWVTPVETPGNQPQTEVTVEFEIFGQKFIALNGGPIFTPSEAVSFVIPCQDQQEVDHYWNLLINDGGQPSQCGWLKDKFGISWQVVPNDLGKYLGGPDAAGRARATQAMLQMQKLDLDVLRAAYLGE
jgi:predicted 3-demethylubiquinone-9 3-methyltransferase (glyoxalase superfamily)